MDIGTPAINITLSHQHPSTSIVTERIPRHQSTSSRYVHSWPNGEPKENVEEKFLNSEETIAVDFNQHLEPTGAMASHLHQESVTQKKVLPSTEPVLRRI